MALKQRIESQEAGTMTADRRGLPAPMIVVAKPNCGKKRCKWPDGSGRCFCRQHLGDDKTKPRLRIPCDK